MVFGEGCFVWLVQVLEICIGVVYILCWLGVCFVVVVGLIVYNIEKYVCKMLYLMLGRCFGFMLEIVCVQDCVIFEDLVDFFL